jgi:protease I
MSDLTNLRVAVVATDGVEEPEIVEPVKALRDAGALVEILSLKAGDIQCFRHQDKGMTLKAGKAVKDARPDFYDALLLPGGALNADALRADLDVQRFVQSFDKEKKPIAFICHAPWILISACLVKGRTLTSYHTIEDDIRNAGGHYVDREVALDFNWVSSRQPSDIPAFNREMLTTFGEFSEDTSARPRSSRAGKS